jgi:radical SAM superfamily enzyme YgiQ (UPF0313 family)
MKTILVNPPSGTYRNPEEHLGLAYIKSFLTTKGYNVEIIDGYLFGMETREVVRRIIEDESCKVVGISPFIDSLKQSLEITREIKKARGDIYVFWGGHLATFSAEDLLDSHAEIDIVIRGEGELTFVEVLEKISLRNSDFESVDGLAIRKNGKVFFTKPRCLIENLDSLPFPDRVNAFKAFEIGSLVQISGSRGCYGNCSFCSINSLYRLSDGRAWRGRSPESIVKELCELNSLYGFDMFKFVDDSFFGPDEDWRERAMCIANGIIASGLSIRFRISTRVNNVDCEVFSRLKQAGLYAVSVGVESGVQRMLDTFNKGTSVKQNIEALQILEELGIVTLMGFIGFDPYVTLEEIQENIVFLKEAMFAMTDLVSKPLYVHADDSITKKLIAEDMITGRTFPNFQYRMLDKRAESILMILQKWNSFNGDVYRKVSDPLTAPRRTSCNEELIILRLHRRLREIDIGVLEGIAKMVEIGYSETLIMNHLEKCREFCISEWDRIETEFNSLNLT